MNKEQIFNHVHNHRDEPLKNDAIYLVRVMQFKSLIDFIEEVMNKSGKDLRAVLGAIVKNKEAVLANYPYAREAFDVLVKDFS